MSARNATLAALVLAFATQSLVSTADWILALGPPRFEEVRALGAAGSSDVVSQALTGSASEDVTLAVPSTWVDGPRRALAEIVLFVDGRGVRVLDDAPDSPTTGRVAYLAHNSRRDRTLRLRCAGPCREALAGRVAPAFQRALARDRLRSRPSALALPLAAILGYGLALRVALASLSPRGGNALAVLGGGALLAWLWARQSSWPAGLLVVVGQLAAAAAVPATRVARGLETALLPPLREASAWLARLASLLLLPRWSGLALVAVSAGLWLPLLLTDRTYYSDWANHLYYVARQAESLRALGRPSYFLHSDLSGPFYPYYAFYGGTLYVLTGCLAIVCGSVHLAYAAAFGAGFAMAHGGAYWLARQAGVRRPEAHLPGVVIVSSAYFLTNAYGRGSWAELIATSALPLVAAAGAAILRGDGPLRRNACLFAAGFLVFSGSHTITLAWGGLFLLALGLIFAPGFPLARRRLLLLVELSLLAGALNAWFLLPAIAYGRSTHIGGYAARGFGSDTQFLNTAAVLFHPGRFVPSESGTPALYTHVSLYALAAALLVLLSTRPVRGADRRAAWGLAGLLGATLLLIMTVREDLTWQSVPPILRVIQFQFRLHTYVTLAIAGLVVLALRRTRGSSVATLGIAVLALATAIQVALGAWQIARSPRYGRISEVVRAGAHQPPTLLEAHDYRFQNHPDAVPLGEPVLEAPDCERPLDPREVRKDRLAVELPWAAPCASNLPYSPFIALEGDVTLQGRSASGASVLAPRSGVRLPTRGQIVAARPAPVAAGIAVSLLSLFTLPFVLYRLREPAQ